MALVGEKNLSLRVVFGSSNLSRSRFELLKRESFDKLNPFYGAMVHGWRILWNMLEPSKKCSNRTCRAILKSEQTDKIPCKDLNRLVVGVGI